MTTSGFNSGDVLISATARDGEVNIRDNVGDGRVLVLGPDLAVKGELFTGERGLVVGLGVHPKTGTLVVTDPTSRSVSRFSPSGEALPILSEMQGVPFGSVAFDDTGNMFLGEHLKSDRPGLQGEGKLYQFDQTGGLVAAFDADRDPGKFGFHGVTSLAVSGDVVTYISETGRRIMRFDTATGLQQEDFLEFSEDDGRVTAGLCGLAEGRLFLSTVFGVSILSASGEELARFPLSDDRGWAAIAASADDKAAYVANFFTGELRRISLADGSTLASFNLGDPFTLAGIVEVP